MFLYRFSSQEPIIFVVNHAESLPRLLLLLLLLFCISDALILLVIWGFE